MHDNLLDCTDSGGLRLQVTLPLYWDVVAQLNMKV